MLSCSHSTILMKRVFKGDRRHALPFQAGPAWLPSLGMLDACRGHLPALLHDSLGETTSPLWYAAETSVLLTLLRVPGRLWPGHPTKLGDPEVVGCVSPSVRSLRTPTLESRLGNSAHGVQSAVFFSSNWWYPHPIPYPTKPQTPRGLSCLTRVQNRQGSHCEKATLRSP